MFLSVTKYFRKCSSFYCLMMSQDNAYKNCLLIRLAAPQDFLKVFLEGEFGVENDS